MAKKRIFSGPKKTDIEKCTNCERRDGCLKSDKLLTAYSILLDCECFYYVFCELENIERTPKFDGNIEKYKKEIEEYDKKHENIPFLTSAMVTNGALALELAMKFLIYNENKQFECGHDLAMLFSQLPKVHTDILKPEIYSEINQNEETFKENINNISNLFIDYRYFFEHESLGFTNFFTELVHIVCNYAVSMKEELNIEMDNNGD